MDLSVASPMRIQDTSPLDGGNYWINGLLQGLARSNLYLHRGGAPTLGSHTRQLLPFTDATEETVRQLHRGGINTWADLLTLQGTLTTDQTLQVIEIMEVTTATYHYREWRPTVQGMRHAVGRQVEWAASLSEGQSERWSSQGQHT